MLSTGRHPHPSWALVALVATACGGAPSEPSGGTRDERVADVAQPVLVEPTLLAPVDGRVPGRWRVSSDENFAYFTQEAADGCRSGHGEAWIKRVFLATGVTSTRNLGCGAHPAQSTPQAFGRLFFRDAWSGGIYSSSMGAHGDELLAIAAGSGGPDSRLLTDGTGLYWSDDEGVKRLARGAVQRVVFGRDHSLLALDSEYLYFQSPAEAGQTKLSRVGKTGGKHQSLYTGPAGRTRLRTLALDDYFVYWHQVGAGVQRMWKFGGTPATVYPVDAGCVLCTTTISSIASDDDRVDGEYDEGPVNVYFAASFLAEHAILGVNARSAPAARAERLDTAAGPVLIRASRHTWPGLVYWVDDAGLWRARRR